MSTEPILSPTAAPWFPALFTPTLNAAKRILEFFTV
jgi:hypothetical protein